jgi:hypothetical protein
LIYPFIAITAWSTPDHSTIAEFIASRQEEIMFLLRKYASRQRDCKDCKLREECLRKKETKRRYLLIPLEKHERDFLKEMIKKIDIEEEREIYSERMKIVEPVFANIRIQKRLNYLTLRGKVKVNIQWLLYCIVHNIGKIGGYGMGYG